MSVKLKLECSFDGTGSSWTTLTSWSGKDYLLQARGIDITEGRDDETGEPISPGTIGFVLDNADYRFSPGITSSPCYPYLEQPGSLLRLSAWVNGAWQKLFYGVAQSWTATLDGDLTGKKSICTVTATNTLAKITQYTMRQASDEVMKRYNPSYYWPLRDSGSPAQPAVGNIQLTANPAAATGWGLGSYLSLDEGDVPHPQFVSGASGLHISGDLHKDDPWTIVLVLLSAPTASPGGAVQLLDGIYSSGDTQRRLMWSDANGAYFGTGAATGLPSAWPVLLAVTSAGVGYMVDADGNTSSTTPSPALPPWQIKKRLTLNSPDLNTGAVWSAGHLAIFSSEMSLTDLSLLAADMLVSSRILVDPSGFLAALVGVSVTGGVTAALPNTEGRDISEVLSALVTGLGARIVDYRDGTVELVQFPPSSAPVAVPKTTSALSWGTSSAGWMSEQSVAFSDSTKYTATRDDGVRKTGEDLEAVHSDPWHDRSMADWNVHSGTMGGRCPAVPIDMMGLTEAQRATFAALMPGSRITVPSYAYMPAGLILIVEGVEHHIDAETWTATFKTSPDIYSRLLIWDSGDTWDGGKLWAP